uniref:SUZ domain-containing protein n=1 Tax=Timema cristinae TaxID=61476 RepID=A0A7R9CZ18_TIMCR|nr:unnamed protein product [Timema cristinae]
MTLSPEHQYSSESRRSKSFEEREEEYEKARKRIFNRENGSCDPLFLRSQESSQEELRWSGDVQPWSSSDSEPPSNRLSLPHNLVRPSRLFKVESFEGRDTLKANSMRQAVAKSYSFGGYPVSVLSRGDSCSSTHSAGARLLTKQDSSSSMSSRLSPSSSGYKSQSQRSDATMSATPSPTATPVSNSQVSSHSPDRTVMWAVTSISSVPPGSLLINPETGQPYVNPDGSAYRYDPANPPRVIVEEESLSSGENPSSPAEPEPSTPDTQISQETQPPAKVNCATSPGLSPVRKVAVAQVTTTATSPSLPVTPPPLTPVNTNIIHQPCSTTLDSNLPPPPPPIYNTTSSTNLMYAAPQQFLPAAPQSEVVYGQQPVIYAGYNMVAGPPHFDNRHSSDSSSMSMSDLSGYLMGMNLVSDQQRGGGDTNNPPMQPPHSYQPPFWHHSTPTAGSQQPPGSVPMYLVPPPPPLVNTSPPQQVNGNTGSAPGTPRYLPGPPPTYATYQPVPTTNQDRAQHTGGYMGGYQVAANGDCVHPLYSQSSLHMLYTPTSINMTNSSGNCGVPATSALSGGSLSYYTPGHPQPPVMSLNMGPPYRAPSSPHTPTQSQPMCSVGAPFMYVNGGGGGGSYAPPYGQQQQSTQYVPPALISNMGIYRSNMKVMSSVRSSPPPRPPRDGSGGPKPPYNSRSPSNASKERQYDGTDKMHRYAPMPMLGIHFMPGGPLQQCVSGPSPALRLPFLPSHPRGHHHDMGLGRPPKPRKQRSKITSTVPGTHQPVPLSSNMATFPTVLKEGLQETDRTVMMTSEESGMKTPQL